MTWSSTGVRSPHLDTLDSPTDAPRLDLCSRMPAGATLRLCDGV